MAPEITSEKLPEPAIMVKEVPLSPGSSPTINSQTLSPNTGEEPKKIDSQDPVSWAKWPQPPVEDGTDVASTNPETESYIYWLSPASMIGCYIVGILMALSHHLYYEAYNGDLVGSPDEQGTKLRIGNFFAFATQFSLAGSVGLAYTQWLWKTLRRRTISISCLDSAFSADSVLLSMLNPEMWWKIKVGSTLALLVWCLQIPSLFTPSTLNVVPGTNVTETIQKVPRLLISTNDTDQHIRFAYSVPILTDTPYYATDTSKIYVGPRTIIERLFAATAATGRILPIDPVSLNSSYSLEFYGPRVKCQEANATEVEIIDHIQRLKMSIRLNNFTQVAMSYFAFVPNDLIISGENVTDSAIAAEVSAVRMQRPSNGTNNFWAASERYVWNSTGDRNIERRHIVCRLFNATYNVDFNFNSGAQTITDLGGKLLNEVPYPKDNVSTITDYTTHSYSAFMGALSDQLVGSMGWWVDNITNQSFSEIAAPIAHSSLLGTVDLDPFFDYNDRLYRNGTTNKTMSLQRQEDKALARNQTLSFLIEELAFNATISFMSSHLLSPYTNNTVYQTTSVNRYSYSSKNLFFAYGFAILATLFANILGVWAYISNGAAHDKSFSAVMGATREAELGALFCHRSHGKLPVPRRTQRTLLRYRKMNDGGWSFRRTDVATEARRRRRSLMTRRRRSSAGEDGVSA